MAAANRTWGEEPIDDELSAFESWDSRRLMTALKYDCVFPVGDESDPGNWTLTIDI
jgi:hypothetical protein